MIPTRGPTTCARVVRPGCSQVFLVFSCALGPGRERVFSEGGLFLERSGLGRRNLLLLKDPHHANFALGVGPAPGSAEGLARWLRASIDGLPHVREVHCVGYSSGAYGALLLGHLIGADSVIAFSPRAIGEPPPRGPQQHGPDHTQSKDHSGPIAAAAEDKLVAALSSHNGKTVYRVHTAPGNARDVALAGRLGKCPGVELVSWPELGATHGTLDELINRGTLADVMPPFAPSKA